MASSRTRRRRRAASKLGTVHYDPGRRSSPWTKPRPAPIYYKPRRRPSSSRTPSKPRVVSSPKTRSSQARNKLRDRIRSVQTLFHKLDPGNLLPHLSPVSSIRNAVCKERPDPNKPRERRARGKGGAPPPPKDFVPWCNRRRR